MPYPQASTNDTIPTTIEATASPSFWGATP